MITYNRPGYLKRSLSYYGKSGIKLIICDGTEKSQADTIEELDCPSVQYLHLPGKSPIERVRFGLEQITTPYCLLIPDDDFFLELGVLQCVDFLEKHPGYQSAQGHYVRYKQKESRIDYILSYTHSFGKDHFSPNADSRLYDFFSEFHVVIYSVIRTPLIKAFFNSVPDFKSHILMELANAYFLLLHGFHKILDVPYCLRELSDQSTGATIPTYPKLLTDPAYQDDLNKFKTALVSWTDALGIPSAREVVDNVFAQYVKFSEKLFKPFNPFKNLYSTTWPFGSSKPIRQYPARRTDSVFLKPEVEPALCEIESLVRQYALIGHSSRAELVRKYQAVMAEAGASGKSANAMVLFGLFKEDPFYFDAVLALCYSLETTFKISDMKLLVEWLGIIAPNELRVSFLQARMDLREGKPEQATARLAALPPKALQTILPLWQIAVDVIKNNSIQEKIV
ncbi:MAG: hypothetical protein A2293_07200 [Elusimicrobia bacterium RIFOXYB2_FULL_49_7]|nr:MAG: hypothetical protein A2293_07200 [Elusimicrobia bacterium RIFOXYB2_FULL_49_7]